jgi:hypothetical protein
MSVVWPQSPDSFLIGYLYNLILSILLITVIIWFNCLFVPRSETSCYEPIKDSSERNCPASIFCATDFCALRASPSHQNLRCDSDAGSTKKWTSIIFPLPITSDIRVFVKLFDFLTINRITTDVSTLHTHFNECVISDCLSSSSAN